MTRQVLIRARAIRNVLLGRPVAYRVNVAGHIDIGTGYAAECVVRRG